MIYLQLIILRLWNFFSYFWKPIAYYNFWKLILHLLTLQIYCLVELIRILVTYWVVSSPSFFPSNFILWRITSFGSFDVVLWARKKLSGFGIGWSSNSFIYLFANWHFVHEVWILFLLNYWRSIHKEIVEVFWIYWF